MRHIHIPLISASSLSLGKVLVPCAFLALLACSGGGGSTPVIPPPPTVTDVYLTGYESNGTKNVAKVWKNGTATPLTDGTREASANSSTLSGSDVYVGGGIERDQVRSQGLEEWDCYVADRWNPGCLRDLAPCDRAVSATSMGNPSAAGRPSHVALLSKFVVNRTFKNSNWSP